MVAKQIGNCRMHCFPLYLNMDDTAHKIRSFKTGSGACGCTLTSVNKSSPNGLSFKRQARHEAGDSSRKNGIAQSSEFSIRVTVVSGVRFIGESLAEALPSQGPVLIAGLFTNLQDTLAELGEQQPDIVLLDAAFPNGPAAVQQIRSTAPQALVVALAVCETPEEVIAWAEAGAAGYIPETASLADIVPALIDIKGGKQACTASVVGGLWRRLSNGSAVGRQDADWPPALTARETEIAQMVVAGMSNKDIARFLNIGLSTAKTHVHHILRKLGLQRRGQAAAWMREHRDPQESAAQSPQGISKRAGNGALTSPP